MGFAFKPGLIFEEDSTVADFFGKVEFASSPQRGRTALGPALATRRSSHHAHPAASTPPAATSSPCNPTPALSSAGAAGASNRLRNQRSLVQELPHLPAAPVNFKTPCDGWGAARPWKVASSPFCVQEGGDNLSPLCRKGTAGQVLLDSS